jgi:hypothetical protein
MTSLATGLALVPLVIAGSQPGHEIEHPMAVVILGGLLTSTLLNLLVLPSVYLRFAGPNRTGRHPRLGALRWHAERRIRAPWSQRTRRPRAGDQPAAAG